MAATEDSKTKPKQPSNERVLALFHKNLDNIRTFYHKTAIAGQVLGYNSMLEIVFGHITTAMEYALAGKEWRPL